MDLLQKLPPLSFKNSRYKYFVQKDCLSSPIIMAFCAAVSIVVPITSFLLYRIYAVNSGLVLGSGCHGPELSFGMLSGVLMIIQLRYLVRQEEK